MHNDFTVWKYPCLLFVSTIYLILRIFLNTSDLSDYSPQVWDRVGLCWKISVTHDTFLLANDWLVKNLVNAHVPFVHVCPCARSHTNFLSNVFSFLLKRAGFNFCPSLPYQEHSKHGFKQIQKASQSANLWKVQKPTLERKGKKAKAVSQPCRLRGQWSACLWSLFVYMHTSKIV